MTPACEVFHLDPLIALEPQNSHWRWRWRREARAFLDGDRAASISPDGRWIVSIVDVNDVVVWNVDQGKVFARWNPFDGKRVGTACFTADGKLNLAAVDQDRFLRLDWGNMLKQLEHFGLGEIP